MGSRRKKHRCVHLGCSAVLAAKDGEYCGEHTCGAFSVAYGQCIARRGHQNKHINAIGEEWGDGEGTT